MRNRVKLTITIAPSVSEKLRQKADANKVSLSSLVNTYLAAALKLEHDTAAAEVLGPELKTTIKKEVRDMSDRLAHLIVRGALDAGSSKQLLFQLLVKEFGVEKARAFKNTAWRISLEELRRPTEGIAELLDSGVRREMESADVGDSNVISSPTSRFED